MPLSTVVPNTTVVNTQEYFWPQQRRQALFGNVGRNGDTRFGQPGASYNAIAFGGSRVWGTNYSQIYGAQIGDESFVAGTSTLNAETEVGSVQALLRSSDFPTPQLTQTEQTRVTRWRFWFAISGAGIGTADDFTGIVWSPTAGTVTGIPPQGNPGFGLVMDGAGAWTYQNFGPGAYPGNKLETVAIPAAVFSTSIIQYQQCDVQLISGSPTRNASFDIQINGTTVVSRNWVSGGAAELPDYSTVAGGLGSTIAGPLAYVDNTQDPNVALHFAELHIIRGQYTRDGIRIED